MPRDPLLNTASNIRRNRPEWREYNTRRFQNKMESLNLQEHQSELKVRAAEMAREQKIKNLDDRLKSQDAAIELMRQRHRNQTNDLRELFGRYQRASSVLPPSSNKSYADSSANGYRCPIAELQKFSKAMDERYEKLKESTPRSTRLASLEPSTRDGVSFRHVKQMLNHLPVTPIFRETTCSLMNMSRDDSLTTSANKPFSRESLTRSSENGFSSSAGDNGRANNNSILGNGRAYESMRTTRNRRDVMVPMKDIFSRNGDSLSTRSRPVASDLQASYVSKGGVARKNSDPMPPKKSVTFKTDPDYDSKPSSSVNDFRRPQGPTLFTNRTVTFADSPKI